LERRNPVPTVDIIIQADNGKVILIRRKNPPHGWAIPGGFVDYGETLEQAAIREAREETSLDVELVRQFHAYSDPRRDARVHTISVVFIARAKAGTPRADDDALELAFFCQRDLPENIVFDHRSIIDDFFNGRY